MVDTWMIGAGVAALLAAGTVAHVLDERLQERRRGGGSWSPALCRLGQHNPASRLAPTPDDPCRHEYRCRTCDRLISAGPGHDWGEHREKNENCVRTALCRRCDAERTTDAHRYRPEERAEGSCQVTGTCEDCGVVTAFREEHDPDPGHWPNACRRCGYWDDIGE
ncbi:hypothetical protein KOI35_15590 [Actinoplanes bogorensis]|uniref:HNH endonuclease n=1 Tax=Paractinoplanes bogorensis TaxID=1610840 RepID=A0ABS5YND0_9ACTN|nr:hypothetical protein [Actinoplanes bogorensis]MBU2664925.1 hypothetical protein [Actinoplanes bogorensis]